MTGSVVPGQVSQSFSELKISLAHRTEYQSISTSYNNNNNNNNTQIDSERQKNCKPRVIPNARSENERKEHEKRQQ